MLLIGTFQAAALLNVAQANLKDAFKSLNHGKQTKWNQPAKKVAICRGSLAWLGRQTHNLESIKGQAPYAQKSRARSLNKARIPLPAPLLCLGLRFVLTFCLLSLTAYPLGLLDAPNRILYSTQIGFSSPT